MAPPIFIGIAYLRGILKSMVAARLIIAWQFSVISFLSCSFKPRKGSCCGGQRKAYDVSLDGDDLVLQDPLKFILLQSKRETLRLEYFTHHSLVYSHSGLE